MNLQEKSIGELLIIKDRLAAEIDRINQAAKTNEGRSQDPAMLDILYVCLLEHKSITEIIERKAQS